MLAEISQHCWWEKLGNLHGKLDLYSFVTHFPVDSKKILSIMIQGPQNHGLG